MLPIILILADAQDWWELGTSKAIDLAGGIYGGVTLSGVKVGNLKTSSAGAKPKINPNVVPEQGGGLPKPGKGKGSVPPEMRDPKRAYSPAQKAQMLENQGGVCKGCNQPKTVDQVHGHHLERHADGGRTTLENGAALCEDCHKQIHK